MLLEITQLQAGGILKATLGSGEEKSYDFRVEDFLPERMALNIKQSAEPLTTRDSADFAIEGHYLYGSPAAGNTLNGNLIIQVARNAVESLPGYLFGNSEDKRFEQNITLEDAKLDDKGEGHVTYETQWSESHSPLNLVLLASLQESGGRPVTSPQCAGCLACGTTTRSSSTLCKISADR